MQVSSDESDSENDSNEEDSNSNNNQIFTHACMFYISLNNIIVINWAKIID